MLWVLLWSGATSTRGTAVGRRSWSLVGPWAARRLVLPPQALVAAVATEVHPHAARRRWWPCDSAQRQPHCSITRPCVSAFAFSFLVFVLVCVRAFLLRFCKTPRRTTPMRTSRCKRGAHARALGRSVATAITDDRDKHFDKCGCRCHVLPAPAPHLQAECACVSYAVAVLNRCDH